ncbi:hypothetical protein GKC56_00740 [Neisseriaceae bacterium PsAf]|nr:hypothetical protein [Neisseriaceae bacterium PsAf]MCV2502954.1 hypothetical protein [Neisseriaceae bacterium]
MLIHLLVRFLGFLSLGLLFLITNTSCTKNKDSSKTPRQAENNSEQVIQQKILEEDMLKKDKKPILSSILYETPSRFIVITSCIDDSNPCNSLTINRTIEYATYYEINKDTSETLKLRSKLKNPDQNPANYTFENDNLIYQVEPKLKTGNLTIINKKLNNKVIIQEPFITNDNNYNYSIY